MALLDPSHRYDRLKAPFRGHALADLLIRRGNKYEFVGSFSFQTEEEFKQLRFRDIEAPEEMKGIDPWTGEPKNVYSYEQVKEHIPTWQEVVQEYEDDLAEYAAYEGKRNRRYPDWRDQLDMLFKDIDSGKLGEAAKSSQFYVTIKQIKDNNP